MNIGIYGGTFNPVHKGHTNCLSSIMRAINFDKVIVLPDRIPPHKQAQQLVSGEDRLNMCKVAFEGIRNVECSDWELRQNGKSYSVITLRHFHKVYPKDNLYFFMGSDMLLCFHKWYCYKEILQLSTLVCISRENSISNNELQAYADKLTSENGGKVIIVPTKPFEASSTQIRDYINKNMDYSCYLDKNVVQYIVEKNLYNEVL